MILVLSNPGSGRNKRDRGLGARLRAILPEGHRFIEPTGPEHTEELVRSIPAGEVSLVCVNGGDGTLAHVLSALCRVWGEDRLPPVAILRGGTMNTVAHGIGLSGRPERILARVVKRHLAGEPQPMAVRHLMRVTDGTGVPRYGFLFGNGVISNFLEVYYEGGKASPLRAALILIRALLSALVGGRFAANLARPTRVRVDLDGRPWSPDSYLSVAAGTVDDLGLGFRVFPRAVRAVGQLQALGFACSAAAVALRIPGTLLARPWNHPEIVDQLGRRLVLRSESPIDYMIEGDFHHGSAEVIVEAGPDVRLIQA